MSTRDEIEAVSAPKTVTMTVDRKTLRKWLVFHDENGYWNCSACPAYHSEKRYLKHSNGCPLEAKL